MKQFTMLVAVALAGSVMLSGCGKKEEAPPAAPAPAAAEPAPATPAPAPAAVEPTPTTPTPAPPAAVQEAPATVVDLVASAKDGVAQAMALAKDGKYQDALALLQKTAAEVQANPDAMKLVNDAIAQVKQMMADAATKTATDKVGGMLGGVEKSTGN
jgi:hypothetical protein